METLPEVGGPQKRTRAAASGLGNRRTSPFAAYGLNPEGRTHRRTKERDGPLGTVWDSAIQEPRRHGRDRDTRTSRSRAPLRKIRAEGAEVESTYARHDPPRRSATRAISNLKMIPGAAQTRLKMLLLFDMAGS